MRERISSSPRHLRVCQLQNLLMRARKSNSSKMVQTGQFPPATKPPPFAFLPLMNISKSKLFDAKLQRRELARDSRYGSLLAPGKQNSLPFLYKHKSTHFQEEVDNREVSKRKAKESELYAARAAFLPGIKQSQYEKQQSRGNSYSEHKSGGIRFLLEDLEPSRFDYIDVDETAGDTAILATIEKGPNKQPFSKQNSSSQQKQHSPTSSRKKVNSTQQTGVKRNRRKNNWPLAKQRVKSHLRKINKKPFPISTKIGKSLNQSLARSQRDDQNGRADHQQQHREIEGLELFEPQLTIKLPDESMKTITDRHQETKQTLTKKASMGEATTENQKVEQGYHQFIRQDLQSIGQPDKVVQEKHPPLDNGQTPCIYEGFPVFFQEVSVPNQKTRRNRKTFKPKIQIRSEESDMLIQLNPSDYRTLTVNGIEVSVNRPSTKSVLDSTIHQSRQKQSSNNGLKQLLSTCKKHYPVLFSSLADSGVL